MIPVQQTVTDPAQIAGLVKKCSQLCVSAEAAISGMSEPSDAFLAQNLEGALEQLELILRALGEDSDVARTEQRQGFLRRLFARDGVAGEKVEGLEPPKFDVSRQGLQGNSWTVGLAELLSFLSFGKKTGLLWVDSPTENFLVALVDGKLMHATSDQTPEGLRLGEVLVGQGFLTRRQLERFLSSDPTETVSGERLLQSGMICDDELRSALSHQIRHLFERLVHTKNAVFRFSEGMEIPLAYQVDLDVNQLLLNSAVTADQDGNPVPRAAAALQEWNSWQRELSGDPAAARPAEPTNQQRQPKQARPRKPARQPKRLGSVRPASPQPPAPADAQKAQKAQKAPPANAQPDNKKPDNSDA